MDKFVRVHCDTVMPQYSKGNYYWQPLGNDVHLLGSGQSFSGEQFEIPSALIYWHVGGFSRSHGEIHYPDTGNLTARGWSRSDNKITDLFLP